MTIDSAGDRDHPAPPDHPLILTEARDLRVVAGARRLVVKVGSSLVTNEGRGLDRMAIARWAGEISRLREGGREGARIPHQNRTAGFGDEHPLMGIDADRVGTV